VIDMTIVMGIAIYFTIWWTVLFAVLPLRIRSQHETGEITPGTDPGAPIAPGLLGKAVVTTLISAVLFAGLFIFMTYFGDS
jgi:predicted secreted protein